MAAVHEWFAAIVPRIASRDNLLLFQIENEYSVPAHLGALSSPLADLLIRWLGSKRLARLASSPWLRRRMLAGAAADDTDGELGQRNTYMRELYELSRRLGVRVPIFHNDVAALSGRQQDVDMLAIDRYPITTSSATGASRDVRRLRGDEARSTPMAARRTPSSIPSCRPAGSTVGAAPATRTCASDSAPTRSTPPPRPRSRRVARCGTTTCSAVASASGTSRVPTSTAPTTTAHRSANLARRTPATSRAG
jgi:hypothetical protein